jgi:hypothetical protein
MKCKAKVLHNLLRGRPEDAVQSKAPRLPAPSHSKYQQFEVAAQPIFNIRKLFFTNPDMDTLMLLVNSLLTTILSVGKAWHFTDRINRAATPAC